MPASFLNILCMDIAVAAFNAVIDLFHLWTVKISQHIVVFIENQRRTFLHSFYYFHLGFQNTRAAAKIFDVRYADVGNNCCIRTCTSGQIRNFTKTVHSHLDYCRFDAVVQLEQGFWQSDTIIKVALCFQGFILCGENLCDHLFCGGLSDTAGYTHHFKLELIAVVSCQIQKSLLGILADNQMFR